MEPNIALFHLLAENRVKYSGFPQLAGLHDLDGGQIRFFEVEPISNHQLHIVLLRRFDHRLAVVFSDCHRLFTEHVNSGTGSPFRVFTMHVVWQSNVDCVYLSAFQALVVLLI